MNIQVSKNTTVILTVALASVVLFFSLKFAYGSGKSKAQAETVVTNAQEVVKGLDYFYSDQNRFPSVEEFKDSNLMVSYFSTFPVPFIESSKCQDNFVYKRQDIGKYQLNFCLAARITGFKAGWNEFTSSK